jgi:hypothetical protein
MRITGVVVSIALFACLAGGQDAERRRNLKASGGTSKTVTAVDKGLAWLAKQQRPDGGWAVDKESAVAPTGLALLAFLGSAYTDQGNHPYVATVRKGLDYLIASQEKAAPRERAIAALALAEALSLTSAPRLKAPVQKALKELAIARKGAKADPLTMGWYALASARRGNPASRSKIP